MTESVTPAISVSGLRKSFGSTTDLRANGDDTGTSTGVINLADYDSWKARFGNSIGAGTDAALSTVPEPPSGILGLLGVMQLLFRKRRGYKPLQSNVLA